MSSTFDESLSEKDGSTRLLRKQGGRVVGMKVQVLFLVLVIAKQVLSGFGFVFGNTSCTTITCVVCVVPALEGVSSLLSKLSQTI